MIVVPVVINLVNFLVEFVQQIMVRFLGYQSQPEEMYAETKKKFYINFINTGLVIFFFNLNWFNGFGLPLPEGEYNEFTTSWYTQVGNTIVITMLLMVFSPHLGYIFSTIF